MYSWRTRLLSGTPWTRLRTRHDRTGVVGPSPNATAATKLTEAAQQTPLPAAPPHDLGIPVTVTQVQVVHAISGESVAAGQTLDVEQIGGVDSAGAVEQMDGNPLLRAGDVEVLFLTRDKHGRYGTVGASQGRFVVGRDGAVRPVDPEWHTFDRYRGVSLGRFLTDIESAIS